MPRLDRDKLNQFKAYKPSGAGVHVLDAQEKAKPVDNNVSLISFFVDGAGGAKPLLSAQPSPVTDPGKLPKVIEATPDQLNALKNDTAAFTRLIESTIQARQAYFKPTFGQLDGAPTHFKFNNIVGQRIKQFVDEAKKLADELYSRDKPKLDAAYFVANTRAFDLLAREIQFDDFQVDGYASFGHDATFLHAWEKRLDELNKVDTELLTPAQKDAHTAEKSQLQGEIDAIFREKYVYNSSSMLETNAESSIGLCLIDRDSRQRVSEKASTLNTIVPAYELLSAGGRAVYYDSDQKKYYFDRSNEEVPAAQVAQIQRRDVDDSRCTFRRAIGDEHLRNNFRFDWDGDGYVSSQVISWVAWGGHCNDKANLEAKGLVVPSDNQGVLEYNALTGSTATYDRKLLNEKLMSFSEMTTLRNDEQEFAAARDDDRPDLLTFGSSIKIPSYDRPNELTINSIEKDGKTYTDPDKIFGQYIIKEDGKSADANPLYLDTVQGDRVRLNLGSAKITASANVQVFDEASGYPTMKSSTITIDFVNPAAGKQLIDSQMLNPATREMNEIYLDVAKKQLITQHVKMEPKQGGGYTRKEVGAAQTRDVDPRQMVGAHETSLDDPNQYFEFVKQALLKAEAFTAETADGAGVWNGVIGRLREAVVYRDDQTKWARVELGVNARYGSGDGSFLVKLNDDGTPKFFVPERFAFDFLWRTKVHFDPELEAQAGGTPAQRGIVTAAGGRVHAEAVSNMLEVLHCAFNKRPYVITHEGVRYYFDDKAQWDAEKQKLDAMRSAIYGAGPGPGPVTEGVLLTDAGHLPKDQLKQYPELVAEADGKMTIKLNTTAGDSDLFVKVGGPASSTDYTKKSELSRLSQDVVSLDVKKGDKVNVAVLGWAESDFNVEVVGPKASQPPPPVKVDFSLDGTLTKGQESRFQIEVKEDGVLNVNLQGTGDADVYLKKGAEPTTSVSDLALENNSTQQQGNHPVKKGDVIYGLVYGYAPTSTFHLHINS